MPANVRNLGLARLLNPDDFEDPRSNPYADEPVDPLPDEPALPDMAPEVSIDVGPPTIRAERPVAPPPAPTGRLSIGRMVPMVPGRAPAPAPEPAPARSPVVPAAGGRSPAAPATPRGDSLLELLQAQRHDSLVRGANSVGDALYGAFTRTKAAPAQGSNMAGEFGARRQLQEHEEDTDPTSERSRAMQALLGEVQPGAFAPEMVAKLSRAQLKELLPTLVSIEQSRAQRQAAIEKAAKDRENKLADLETARKNKLADRDAQWAETRARDTRLDASRKERAEIMAGAKKEAAGDKSLEDLAKRMPPESAALLVKLDKMSKLIGGIDPNAKGEISGVGPAEGRVPDWAEPYVIDEEGQDVRQLAKGVTAMLLKMQSGTAASEGEVRRKMTELGMAPGSTSRQFRTGLTNLRDEMGASLRHQAAGFSPETVKKFREQGGVTAEDIEQLGKSATVKVRHKRSGKVKEMSGAAAQRALADPDFEEAR